MNQLPFVGLMGIQSPEDRVELSKLAPLFAGRSSRLLLGTYADWWTLHGAPGRPFFPSRETLSSLCSESGVEQEPDEFADLAVHFTPAPERPLPEQLYQLMAACPCASTIVLHAVWPRRDTLIEFRRQWPAVHLVLWVSQECFIDLADKTTRVAKRVTEYAQIGAIDAAMFDLASGCGAPIDNPRAVMVLRLLRQAGVTIPCGVAGGLSAERFDQGLSGIVREFNPLSLVASRHIRQNGRVDATLARQFVERALLASSANPLQP